ASKGNPALHREIDADLTRGAAWLMLGVDPAWVLRTLRDRWLKTYQRHREKVLGTLDFAAGVSDLAEFQEVPSYAIEMMIDPKEQERYLAAPEQEMEKILRLWALVAQSGFLPVFKQFSRYKDQTKEETVSFQARKVARIYLEHRRQILSQLRPWLPEERMAKVRGLPEVQELRHQDVLVNAPISLTLSWQPIPEMPLS